MNREKDSTGAIIPLADARRRRQALKVDREDVIGPIRQAFLEDFGDLLEEYVENVLEVSGGDLETMVEEIMAAMSTSLAIAAEDYFEDREDQFDFIDGVAESAAELIEDEEEGDGQAEGDAPR